MPLAKKTLAVPRISLHSKRASRDKPDGLWHLNDKLVLDHWTTKRALADSVTLPLEAGPHRVVLEQRRRTIWLRGRLCLGIAREGQIVDAEAKKLASRADVVVVVVVAGFDFQTESEGADRTFRLSLSGRTS